MLLYNVGKTAVMLAGGAIMGFLYVLLLPFAWTVAAVVIIMKRIVDTLVTVATKSTAFGWRPVEAYLTGKKKKKKAEKKNS